MTEQELFEKMNTWARIHGIPLDAREGKIKEEEPPFALPVAVGPEAGKFDEVYPPSCNTPARSKILDEILSPPAAWEKPKRLDSLSKEEILAGLVAEGSAGHTIVPGMLTPDFLPPDLIPPGACRSKEGRIIPPQGGSGTARPVSLRAKPSFAGRFEKHLNQLWQTPADNWDMVLLDLIGEHLGKINAERADEVRKMHEELEKDCKERTRKAVAAALTNLTRESFEEIRRFLRYSHLFGKNLDPDFFRARLGLDPATGEYVSRPPKAESDPPTTPGEKRSDWAKRMLAAPLTNVPNWHPDPVMRGILRDDAMGIKPGAARLKDPTFPLHLIGKYYEFRRELRKSQLIWMAHTESDGKILPPDLANPDPEHPDDQMHHLNLKRLVVMWSSKWDEQRTELLLQDIDRDRETRLRELSAI